MLLNQITYSLRSPENLHIIDDSGKVSYGCNQKWYGKVRQRMSGCGPTAATNLMLYLFKAKIINLPFEVENKYDCTMFMEDVWRYVTPGARGTNRLDMFYNGLDKFNRIYRNDLRHFYLDIPEKKSDRPDVADMVRFIADGLNNECPVAFLNLSNGKVENLDRWHWVIIVEIETDKDNSYVSAKIYDGPYCEIIDLKLWLETTTLDGGFVYFKPSADTL